MFRRMSLPRHDGDQKLGGELLNLLGTRAREVSPGVEMGVDPGPTGVPGLLVMTIENKQG